MIAVAGYELDEARRYGAEGNLWVADVDACADAGAIAVAGVVRLGLDPLGAQSSGDIVAISFAAVGSLLAPGATLRPSRRPSSSARCVRRSGAGCVFNEQALEAPGATALDRSASGLSSSSTCGRRTGQLVWEAALRAWFERVAGAPAQRRGDRR